MKTVRWFLFVLTIFLYSACSECSCINNDLGVGINFINFDSTEVDTIIVKKYQKGTGFTKKIDSTLFQEGDYRLKRKGDTLSFSSYIGEFSILPQFDYKILLQTGRETNITEIVEEQVRGSCSGKKLCINPIVSAKMDSILHYFNDAPNLFIKK